MAANGPPNQLLAAARRRRRSPSGSGRDMSRQELADAVNTYLWTTYRERDNVDATYIGHLEQGRYRWPKAHRREAFRHVLQAATDAELGFWINRGTSTKPTAAELSLMPTTPSIAVAGLGAGPSATALTLEDLRQILAAVDDARRYLDATVVDHFRQRLAECADEDGRRGPRAALPATLAIVGLIEAKARDVPLGVRRVLLGVGARGAELAGWLYRDAGMPQHADYWRDRATEWALEVGDHATAGYILIKKSQSAWDERDAVRMLALAQAARHGPWPLPPRVRAEAYQQEARGLAMLEGFTDPVVARLDQARQLLTQDRPPSHGSAAAAELAVHYDASLLKLQIAMCHAEGGQAEQAVEIYRQVLPQPVFSPRDHAYFTTQMGHALVAIDSPDEAAAAGSSALPTAIEAQSARTMRELRRLGNQLRPWADRPAVRHFREQLAS